MRQDGTMNSRGYEIDFRDLLARLFDKWVIVLVFLLIGAAVGYLLAARSNRGQSDQPVSQAEVEQAREALSKEDADHVEYLYHQYVSYNEYRDSLESYLSQSLYEKDEFENSVILTSVYYVDSSVLKGAGSVLRLLSLGVDDCEEIAGILGNETESLDDVYRRVNISGISGETEDLHITSSADESTNYVFWNRETDPKDDQLFQLWVIADTREQAEQITEVVEASFRKDLEELKKVDDSMELVRIGQNLSSDVYTFFRDKQTKMAADLFDASYQVYRLNEEFISPMGGAEKHLFNMLEARDQNRVASGGSGSLKKNLLIGALIGLIIGVVLVILQYLLNGKLKNVKELSERFRVEVPYVIYRKMKRPRLFGGVIRRLIRADLSDEAIRQQMAAADIAIKLEKSGFRQVCLLCDNVSEQERQMAENLAGYLKKKSPDLEVALCNPLLGVEELEAFSGMDAVVILTQIKKTPLITIQKWAMLCERYLLPIAGAVALEEC